MGYRFKIFIKKHNQSGTYNIELLSNLRLTRSPRNSMNLECSRHDSILKCMFVGCTISCASRICIFSETFKKSGLSPPSSPPPDSMLIHFFGNKNFVCVEKFWFYNRRFILINFYIIFTHHLFFTLSYIFCLEKCFIYEELKLMFRSFRTWRLLIKKLIIFLTIERVIIFMLAITSNEATLYSATALNWRSSTSSADTYLLCRQICI